jgi:hypothetical protein
MNDSLDRNLVLIIFIVSLSYLNYLSIQIRTRTGWSNVTCNPLNLFANSIFQTQEEANKDFERCIVSLSASTTTKLFSKQRNDQDQIVHNLTSVSKQYGDLSKKVENYTKEIKGAVKEYNQKIDGVKATQNAANKLNQTTTKKLDGYTGQIETIFANIKNYFNNL